MDRSRVIQKYHHPVLAVAFLSVTVLVTFILTYLVYDDNTRSICESLKYDCDDATTSDIPTISFTFVPESNWVISGVGLAFASIFAVSGLRHFHEAFADEVAFYHFSAHPRVMAMPPCLCCCMWCCSFQNGWCKPHCGMGSDAADRIKQFDGLATLGPQTSDPLDGLDTDKSNVLQASGQFPEDPEFQTSVFGHGGIRGNRGIQSSDRNIGRRLGGDDGCQRRCRVAIDSRIWLCSWIAQICAVLMGVVGLVNLKVNYYAHSTSAAVMFSAGLVWLFTITSMQHKLRQTAPPVTLHRGWRYTLKSAACWLMVVTFVVNVVLGLLMRSSSWRGMAGLRDWSVWSQDALNEYAVAASLALGVCSTAGDILAHQDRIDEQAERGTRFGSGFGSGIRFGSEVSSYRGTEVGVREGMRSGSGSGGDEERGTLHANSGGMGSAMSVPGRLETGGRDRGDDSGDALEESLLGGLGEGPGSSRLTC